MARLVLRKEVVERHRVALAEPALFGKLDVSASISEAVVTLFSRPNSYRDSVEEAQSPSKSLSPWLHHASRRTCQIRALLAPLLGTPFDAFLGSGWGKTMQGEAQGSASLDQGAVDTYPTP